MQHCLVSLHNGGDLFVTGGHNGDVGWKMQELLSIYQYLTEICLGPPREDLRVLKQRGNLGSQGGHADGQGRDRVRPGQGPRRRPGAGGGGRRGLRRRPHGRRRDLQCQPRILADGRVKRRQQKPSINCPMRQVPLECDINIAVNGPFWVEVMNPEHLFMAMLISRS